MSKDNGLFEYKFQGTGLTTSERRVAEKQFEAYRSNYPHLHKLSDLGFLEELVFQEMLHNRLKEKISYLTKKKKVAESDAIPEALQRSISSSIDLQLKLKEKIGLLEDKQKLDAFRYLEELKEDFKEHRKRNPLQYKTTCPYCSEYFYLKRRTEGYEEIKDAWFRDKTLCNPELWDSYQCKEITKERIAKILGVSEDYIDWLKEKIFATTKQTKSKSPISNEAK